MRRRGVPIGILAALAVPLCGPGVSAASPLEGTVTLLKGSTLTVTYPDGTVHTQLMRGTFRGTVPSGRRTPPFRIALEVSNAYVPFGRDAVLCGGGRSTVPWRQVFILADRYGGAPPSWVRVGADGGATLSWSVTGLNVFTGCSWLTAPSKAETLTLTGSTTSLGLRRLVLRGGATSVATYDGPASFSVKLVTRVAFE